MTVRELHRKPAAREGIAAEIERGEFDGYRMLGVRWMGDEDGA